VALRDGSVVVLRPIRGEDETGLMDLHLRLSPESSYQRFFAAVRQLPPDWAHTLAHVDYDRRMAVVAVDGDDRLIGVARYDHDPRTDEAEVAVVVEDRWQHRGLGGLLLRALFDHAHRHGIDRFRAYVLSSNQRMLDVFARLCEVRDRQREDGVTSLLLVPRPGVA
jgi:acetyltransferase